MMSIIAGTPTRVNRRMAIGPCHAISHETTKAAIAKRGAPIVRLARNSGPFNAAMTRMADSPSMKQAIVIHPRFKIAKMNRKRLLPLGPRIARAPMKVSTP